MTTVSIEERAEQLLQERVNEERRALLQQLVEGETERREREAAERTRLDEVKTARQEADALLHGRLRAMTEFRARLDALAGCVRSLVDLDDQLGEVSARAGVGFRSWRQATVELAVIALADAGLRSTEPLPFVPAATRRRLLDEFSDEPAGTPEGLSVARCTVCMSPHRGEVDDGLRRGVTLREMEQSYGLSRSALHRHREHAG